AYDQNGLISSVTDPMQRTTSYEWSASGELRKIIDPEGHQRVLTYDHWGQLSTSEIIFSDGQNGGVVQFFYTPTGKIEKVVAPNSDTTTYAYNDNDQLIRY